MSFLEMAEELEKTLLTEEKEEKPKKEKKEKSKRERKPRQPKIDTTKIINELNAIKQAINALQTQNANRVLDAKTIQEIAQSIAKAIIQQIQSEIKNVVATLTENVPQGEIGNVDINKLAEAIVSRIISDEYTIHKLSESIQRRKKIKIPKKLLKKDLKKRIQTIQNIEEKILYILFYRFCGVQPSELAKILEIDKHTAQQLLYRMRQEGKVAKRKPYNRYIANMDNDQVIETLQKYWDPQLIQLRKRQFEELKKKGTIYF